MMVFEPKILAFLCNWCSYAGADLAGVSRFQYPPNVLPIRVMCSSRVSPEHIFQAFDQGADGVFVAGCHPGDCHYINGNYKTLRKVKLTKKMLEQIGINPKRLRLEWISSVEGVKFAEVVREMTEELKELGPIER
ncbi:MAG TPA: hydrogenase iron-sulfur subunit [Thermoplasmata archaeon]|nr:hydrogenase iron-sulfur subunit [Thermoplasmata archaeon]